MTSKLSIYNKGPDDLVVWVEPLARDYTLESGETATILPSDEEASLELSREGNAVQVFLEASSDFRVEQDGIALECGHKRKS